jgi:glutamine synthetase
MIRGLMIPGDRASRIENRVAEPAANPYLYFASQILSGLDGVERRLEAPAPVENPYASDAVRLPTSLIGAIERFEASAFYKKTLGPDFVAYLTHIKRSEWERYLTTISEWEQREYFSLF